MVRGGPGLDREARGHGLGQGLTPVALALILARPGFGSAAFSPPTTIQNAEKASVPRSRPLYEAVLEQCRYYEDAAKSKEATLQLGEWLAEWSESGYGLEEPDPDRVLASAVALGVLARDARRAEELHGFLGGIEEMLGESSHPHPDLCLALARGWLALQRAAFWVKIRADERARGLARALEGAEAIEPADQRDALGCQLAYALYSLRLAEGSGRESAQVLEDALARFPGDPATRPWLLAALADERRMAGDWNQAWARLREAEESRPPPMPGNQHDMVLERTLAGVRCQLELTWGLSDQAVLSFERQERAFKAGARDQPSHLDLLLNASGVALVAKRPAILGNCLQRLEEALAQERLFADWPRARAQLRARRALVQGMLEDVEPGSAARSAGLLAAAFDDPELDETHRASVGFRLFEQALHGGDWSAAGRWLERLDRSPGEAGRARELTAFLAAARAKLALARGASAEELQRHDAEVREQHRSFVESLRERPEREGGLGVLGWRDRRLLVGTVLELGLALEGVEQAVDRILPEQELASLARRLGCTGSSVAAARAELLGQDVGLLLYLPGWKSTHLFCVDSKGVEHVEIPWAYDLEPLPRDLAERLARSPESDSEGERAVQLARIEADAATLAARLLPPIVLERLRGWKGAYLAGGELFGTVPFECLPLGGSRLGERIALASLPSVPVGLELARRSRKAGEQVDRERLLLVAAPEFTPAAAERFQLTRFALDAAEISALTAPFERKLVLTGKDASWSGVRSALAPRTACVLHVLTHGVNDPTRELSGGLALAPGKDDPDGLLWCEELFGQAFVSPPLVILSACGSARGPRRLGDDGLAQLGGAFFTLGATCTAQASGNIALGPTIRLMEVFTRALAGGASPAGAMRAAREELVQEPGLRHPFYACSMRVVGLGLEPGPR